MPTKVLVVDDDQDTLILLKLVLENAGYQALLAETGEEALRILAEGPALVLCDILMPAFDGYEILAAIRSDPKTADLPVLMLSALGQEGDVQRARERGADGYIVKPFTLRGLLTEVRSHLRAAG
jgi:CheY-like chemotaxis protein